MCLEIKGLWNAHLCCMTRSMLDIHLIRHLFPTRWLKIICSPTICFDTHIDQIGETPTLTQMIHGASFGNGAITPVRGPKADALLILDDTLCEHVGSLFDYMDRHYNHGDATYPLAHNPVTSHYVSGPVRFPLDLRLYRRYEELTHWEAFVHKHIPDRVIPTKKKERTRF